METVRYKTAMPSRSYRFREAPSSQSVGNVFDLGWKNNWCQIMGYQLHEWFLPIRPRGMTDGTSFPINKSLWQQVQQRADEEYELAERQRSYLQRQRDAQRQEMVHIGTLDYADDSTILH